MPREITNHERLISAFQSVDIISELVEKLPNGEFKNELEMDVILFGRSYRGKQVGPYVRLLEFAPGETIIREGTWESSLFFILVQGPLHATVSADDGGPRKVGEIPPGNTFGEMALLSGTRRSANVVVPAGGEPAFVLEFTRPAIRLLRKLPKFGRSLDRSYRAYGLNLALNELRDFTELGVKPDVLKRLGDAARFSVYEKDHILFREGDPINRIFFVRNGWIERVSGVEFDPEAADLLLGSDENVKLDLFGAGTALGLETLSGEKSWNYTAVVKGRTEVIEVAASRLKEDVEMSSTVVPVIEGLAGPRPAEPEHPGDVRALRSGLREIDTGVVDGVNLLVMDMAKCIRCGNCSYACHQVHGHTRLTRRGIHIERPLKPGGAMQSVLVPSVCIHCQDAECLTGCPTGAIARYPDGEIDINSKTCIGCGDCATQCPYNAISMIPRQNASGAGALSLLASFFAVTASRLPSEEKQTDDLLAIKCNLCRYTPLNPQGAKTQAYSCEENCPTGALLRVDPREYFDEAREALGISRRSKTHAIGENIHKFDLRATILHVVGIFAVVLGGGAAIWATREFTQDEILSPGTWITMRWITGLAGLAGIGWVMAYPVRKQIYRRRAGALRYWMLSHIYIGVLAGVLLLVHGGTSSGGLLTTTLMISFDLVIVSGIFGAISYWTVPRLMTRIEREPLLIEDLEKRRDELTAQLADAAEHAGHPKLRELLLKKVRTRLRSLSYLLRQYMRKEDLASMLADAREQFRDDAARLSRNDAARLMDAVENAATLSRVNAIVLLHRLLRVWVAPHVVFTALMLALMVVHIVQVVFFNVN